MKVLLLFADMLRTNLLNVYDKKNPNTSFDDFLRNTNGGVYYKNSWTPGPDTPRSSGCLFSSRYPKHNGCDTRIKYPYYYLVQNNFLNVLKENEYQLNFYINDGVKNTGLLPSGLDTYANFSHNLLLNDWITSLKLASNSLTFIYLSDYHQTVSEFNATLKSHIKGIEYIAGAISTVDRNIGLDNFDLLIIFSDHGFKLQSEKTSRSIDLIGENRCKIFLYIRQKIHKEFSVDNRLCSILDIGPTVLTFLGIGIPYAIDGVNLLDNLEHEFVLIEEHKKFNVTLEQTIEYWAVKEKDCLTVFDCHLNYDSTKTLNDSEKNRLIEICKNHGSHFFDNIKQQSILDSYKNETILNNKHYNGKPVVIRLSLKQAIKNIVKRILRIFIDI